MQRYRRFVIPLAAALLMLGFTLSVFQQIRQEQDDTLKRALASKAEVFGRELQERLRSRLDVAYLLKEAVEGRDGLVSEVFPDMAETLHGRSEEIQAVNWIDADGVIRLVVPKAGNEAAQGLDISDLPVPSRIMNEALRTRTLRVSPPITLAQGGNGFVAYIPAFRDGVHMGYVNVAFRSAPLIDALATRTVNNRVHLSVQDGAELIWASPGAAAEPAPQQTSVISVGQRTWRVTAAPTAAGLAASQSWLDELVLTFGMLAAAAVGIIAQLAQQAHATLRDREERFELAMKGATDGIFDWNADTGKTYYSPRWFTMLGYEPGEIEPGLETFLSLLHPDDEPRLRRKRAQGSYRDEIDEEEFRMRHKNGGWVHILSRATVLRDNGRVKRIVGTHVDITDLRRQQMELELAATTDALTGLRNRRGLVAEIEKLTERLVAGERLMVFHLDLDLFKSINDMHGHDAGDVALRTTAERLLSDPAQFDIVARVGGDEFLLAKRFSGDDGKAVPIANETILRVSDPVDYDTVSCRMGATIGVSFLEHGDGPTADMAIKAADIALGAAKKRGRGRMMIFSEHMQQEAVAAAGMRSEIEEALERGEFLAHFQPQVDTQTQNVVGLEALARWQHPQKGLLSGAAFVPVAEEGNLIGAIDRVVLQDACKLAARLPGLGLPDATVSINISTSQLMDPDLAKTVANMLTDHGASPGQFRVEILESTLLSKRARAIADNVQRLADLGIRMDLDDFGTGHTAISSLLNYPISRVKIDRSLITDIHSDARKQAITIAIVEMCKSLSIEVLAEGVETFEEMDCLREIGCHAVQGYYIAAPFDQGALFQGGDRKSHMRFG